MDQSNEAADDPSATLSDATLLARIVQEIGADDGSALRLHGGEVNVTHRVTAPTGDVVVRFPRDRRRHDEFPVERWATRTAAAAGLPVARTLSTGAVHGVPFIVSEYVAQSQEPVERPWSWLGSYARTIGTFDLSDAPASVFSRFGRDLEDAWRQHLAYNGAELRPDDPIAADGAYATSDLARIRSSLSGLEQTSFTFGLAHGDLAPRNLLSAGSAQPPVLIDWGGATTGPAPWTEARRAYEWAFCDRTITEPEYAELLTALGLDPRSDNPTIAAMVVLHLIDVTRWPRDIRPDLYPAYVLRCRRGLDATFAR